MIRIEEIKLNIDEDESLLKDRISHRLGILPADIVMVRIVKKSVDSRKREIKFNYVVDAELNGEDAVLASAGSRSVYKAPVRKPALGKIDTMKLKHDPVIIGAGPAGLFAALYYIHMGYKPVIIERGGSVAQRKKDVDSFWERGLLSAESNVHFGLGGAGTFSDGKLTSGIKDDLCRYVLDQFVSFGAPAEISYSSKPHIGTDYIRKIVENMRSEITEKGGEFKLNTKVTDLEIDNSQIRGAVTPEGVIECDTVVLAVGNNARDTYKMLLDKGVAMSQKRFSVGVRIEHPQALINAAQYKDSAGHPGLGAADYKLVHHSPGCRSAYTFCMCPGGYVIPASSEHGTVAVNGMSMFARSAVNSNSAIVVGVGPADYADAGALAGIEYQRKLEKDAFEAGGSDYRAPVQLVKDFIERKPSSSLGGVYPSYSIGYTLTDLNEFLPEYISEALREAIKGFSGKVRDFMRADALLTGVETHTSSPVRIMRDERHESSMKGLYPAGEGSGYAGGIMSSAVDGIKTARASVALR